MNDISSLVNILSLKGSASNGIDTLQHTSHDDSVTSVSLLLSTSIDNNCSFELSNDKNLALKVNNAPLINLGNNNVGFPQGLTSKSILIDPNGLINTNSIIAADTMSITAPHILLGNNLSISSDELILTAPSIIIGKINILDNNIIASQDSIHITAPSIYLNDNIEITSDILNITSSTINLNNNIKITPDIVNITSSSISFGNNNIKISNNIVELNGANIKIGTLDSIVSIEGITNIVSNTIIENKVIILNRDNTNNPVDNGSNSGIIIGSTISDGYIKLNTNADRFKINAPNGIDGYIATVDLNENIYIYPEMQLLMKILLLILH